MSRRLFHRLLIVVIHLVNALGLFVSGSAGKFSFLHGQIPDKNAVIRLVGNHLRNDIFCSLQSRRRVGNLFFLADISGRLFENRRLCILL